MPQDVSKDRIDRNLPEDPLSLQPWSMEGDADRLMDDLFADIDRVLDGGTHLPKEPVKPEYVYLQPMQISTLDLKPALEASGLVVLQQPEVEIAPTQSQDTKTAETRDPEVEATDREETETSETAIQDIQLPEVAIMQSNREDSSASANAKMADNAAIATKMADNVAIATKTEGPEETIRHNASGNNFLWLIVGGFLTIPLVLFAAQLLSPEHGSWWQFSSLRQRFFSSTPNSPLIIDPQEIAAADAQFANYMRRSLELIDQQIAARQEVATAPTSADTETTSTPEPVATDRLPPVPNRVPTVLERVYIPVYQPPPALSPVIPSPGVTPPSPDGNGTVPPSSVATAPSPPPLPMQPLQPSTHTLVGVLELGDRSAALFDIDGVTRRIKIGEAIGASGWMLADISNQEAIVRRNGEVRSIYVGQKF